MQDPKSFSLFSGEFEKQMITITLLLLLFSRAVLIYIIVESLHHYWEAFCLRKTTPHEHSEYVAGSPQSSPHGVVRIDAPVVKRLKSSPSEAPSGRP